MGSSNTNFIPKLHYVQSPAPAIMGNLLCVGLGTSRRVTIPHELLNHKGKMLSSETAMCGPGTSHHVAIPLLSTSDYVRNKIR